MTKFLLKHRILILITGLMVTLLLGINVIFLEIDGSFTTILPEVDPDFLFNRHVEKTFGSSDEIIILIKDEESIYRESVIRLINELTHELANLETVTGGSIFNILTASDFNIEILNASEKIDVELISELKRFMETDPLSSGIIVNNEGTSTLIFAPVPVELSLSEWKLKKLAEDVKVITEKLRVKYPGIEIIETGHPIVNAEIMDKMANDLFLLFPIAVLAVALMLMYILKSFKGMLIPILITLAAVIWTFGLKGLLRSSLTITETVIPVILISVACADGIHIVSEAFHYMHQGYTSRTAIAKTMSQLWKPVVLTSLTTAIGFASFIFSKGESLRNMGLFLSFGVMTAMLFSLVYIPVIISWYKPVHFHKKKIHYDKQLKLLRHIEHFTEAVLRKRGLIVLIAFGLLGLSFWGMMNINTDTDEIRYFKKGNPVRQSAEIIEKEMGGISALQIVLESEEDNIFKDLTVLQNINKLQEILEARPEVSYTMSLADFVSYFYYRIRGSRIESFEIPDNQLFLQRMFRLIEGSDDPGTDSISAFVNDTYKSTKITVRLNDSNTSVMENLLKSIQPELKQLFDDRFSIGYAGDYLRLSNGRVIVESQVFSLTLTLLTIIVVLALMYRSPVIGLIVSLPVMIAVLFNFAIMWIFNVSLNPATSIIAAVGLGVGIDYSIHLYSRFQYLYRKNGQKEESIVNAVVETSRGILSNALSVGLGFLILLLSAYRIINDMGWIIALSMATTSITSLVLLPVLLSFKKKFNFMKNG